MPGCPGQEWEAAIFRHILIATDGSQLAAKAVSVGLGLARTLGSAVTVLTVTEPLASLGAHNSAFPGVPDSMRRQALAYLDADARRALAAAKALAPAGLEVAAVAVECPHPHEAILSEATSRGADLVVMASHGRSGVPAVLLGSVTQKVLTHSRLPVLVCR